MSSVSSMNMELGRGMLRGLLKGSESCRHLLSAVSRQLVGSRGREKAKNSACKKMCLFTYYIWAKCQFQATEEDEVSFSTIKIANLHEKNACQSLEIGSEALQIALFSGSTCERENVRILQRIMNRDKWSSSCLLKKKKKITFRENSSINGKQANK